MKIIFDTLFPIILLVALGTLLARIRFLGSAFISDLNKLVFWVAIPALLFQSAAQNGPPFQEGWLLIGILMGSILIVCGLSYLFSKAFRFPPRVHGTLAQSAFRGNLAFIALPVLTFSLSGDPVSSHHLSKAVFTVIAIMVFINVLSVLVLRNSSTSAVRPGVFKSVATNPLVISGLLGTVWGAVGWPLPVAVSRSLESLGSAGVPIALICVGGTLLQFRGFGPEIAVSVILKVVILPLVAWGGCVFLGLDPAETRIALVLAACPTAAVAFVMASKMGGDESLAGATIAVSTLCAAPVLAWALWVTE